ncbi:hypothetical protein PV326_001381, partial [Microctonus aethiopoides]
MCDLTNFGEQLINKIVEKLANKPSNNRTSSQFPLPDGIVRICDDFSMECSGFMLVVEAKTMKKRMNHIIRAYWPEVVRLNLVLKKSKKDRAEVRNEFAWSCRKGNPLHLDRAMTPMYVEDNG